MIKSNLSNSTKEQVFLFASPYANTESKNTLAKLYKNGVGCWADYDLFDYVKKQASFERHQLEIDYYNHFSKRRTKMKDLNKTNLKTTSECSGSSTKSTSFSNAVATCEKNKSEVNYSHQSEPEDF